MSSKKDFIHYKLKFRNASGLHTREYPLASQAMTAFAELRSTDGVIHAAWFSAGGHCFDSFTREPVQGVLQL